MSSVVLNSRFALLIARSFLGLVVGTATIMLFFQMHVLNIHFDFSNSVEQYMEQQMKFHTQLYQPLKKQGQAYARVLQQDLNYYVDDSNGDLDPILHILRQAGYDISSDQEIQREALPSWVKIVEAYGQPTILGLETCKHFRDKVDPSLRNLGVAGLFNSGVWKH
jgi:hypothetical protein